MISFILVLIINFFSNNTVSMFETFMTISMMNTKSGTNWILPHRSKRSITLDLQKQKIWLKSNRKSIYSTLIWYQIRGANRGGGGGGTGGTRPPTFFQVGDGISNVSPTFCGYDENWNFFMHFFFFFFFFLLVKFFSDARRERYPYKLFDADGAPPKKVSESPPPAYQLFWDLRVTFGGSVYVPPPPPPPPTIRFGFAPLYQIHILFNPNQPGGRGAAPGRFFNFGVQNHAIWCILWWDFLPFI